jgi:hypothetical protein
MNNLRDRRFCVSIANRSALKPLKTANADVLTGVLRGWDWMGEVLFEGRFPNENK